MQKSIEKWKVKEIARKIQMLLMAHCQVIWWHIAKSSDGTLPSRLMAHCQVIWLIDFHSIIDWLTSHSRIWLCLLYNIYKVLWRHARCRQMHNAEVIFKSMKESSDRAHLLLRDTFRNNLWSCAMLNERSLEINVDD